MENEVSQILRDADTALNDIEKSQLEKKADEVKNNPKIKESFKTELENKFKVKDHMLSVLRGGGINKSEIAAIIQLYLIICGEKGIKINGNIDEVVDADIIQIMEKVLGKNGYSLEKIYQIGGQIDLSAKSRDSFKERYARYLRAAYPMSIQYLGKNIGFSGFKDILDRYLYILQFKIGQSTVPFKYVDGIFGNLKNMSEHSIRKFNPISYFKIVTSFVEKLSKEDCSKFLNDTSLQNDMFANLIKYSGNMCISSVNKSSRGTEYVYYQAISNIDYESVKLLQSIDPNSPNVDKRISKKYLLNYLKKNFAKQYTSDLEGIDIKDISNMDYEILKKKLEGYDDKYNHLGEIMSKLNGDSSKISKIHIHLMQSRLRQEDGNLNGNPLKSILETNYDKYRDLLRDSLPSECFRYLCRIGNGINTNDKEKIKESISTIGDYRFSVTNSKFFLEEVIGKMIESSGVSKLEKDELMNFQKVALNLKDTQEGKFVAEFERVKKELGMNFDKIFGLFLEGMKGDDENRGRIKELKISLENPEKKKFMESVFTEALKRTDQTIFDNKSARGQVVSIMLYHFNYVLGERMDSSRVLSNDDAMTMGIILNYYKGEKIGELAKSFKDIHVLNIEEAKLDEKLKFYGKTVGQLDQKLLSSDIGIELMDRVINSKLLNNGKNISEHDLRFEVVSNSLLKKLYAEKFLGSEITTESVVTKYNELSNYIDSIKSNNPQERISMLKTYCDKNLKNYRISSSDIDKVLSDNSLTDGSILKLKRQIDGNDTVCSALDQCAVAIDKIEHKSQEHTKYYDSKEFSSVLQSYNYYKDLGESGQQKSSSSTGVQISNVTAQKSIDYDYNDNKEGVSIPSKFGFEQHGIWFESKNPFYNPNIPKSTPSIGGYLDMGFRCEFVKQYLYGLGIDPIAIGFSEDDLAKKIGFKYGQDLTPENIDDYMSGMLTQVEKVLGKMVYESIIDQENVFSKNDSLSPSQASFRKSLNDCGNLLLEEFNSKNPSKKSLIQFFSLIKGKENQFKGINLLVNQEKDINFGLLSDGFGDDLGYINNYFDKKYTEIAYGKNLVK